MMNMGMNGEKSSPTEGKKMTQTDSGDTPPSGATSEDGMNKAHIAAAGAASMTVTQALADVYDWVLNWPLHSPTTEQCLSLAVLTVAALGGGGFAFFTRSKS